MSSAENLLHEQMVLLCRSGFESECAQEAVDVAAAAGLGMRREAASGSGMVRLACVPATRSSTAWQSLQLEKLIFTRQILRPLATVHPLPARNRVEPLLEAAARISRGRAWSSLEILARPAGAGEDLQRFVRRLASPLAAALRQAGFLSTQRSDADPLVVLFEDFEAALLADLDPDNRASSVDGVPRLKMPPGAPSRSTLKLEEAWHVFIGQERWQELLGQATLAVDLGAAPGGWTWQLVRQGLEVIAVDNADLDPVLRDYAKVRHVRADGFTFKPPSVVDWMVCDMVEQPIRVTELVCRWLVNGWCRCTVFNLKLPMKKRYQEVLRCLALLRETLDGASLEYHLAARQLYHDREEITCFVELAGRT